MATQETPTGTGPSPQQRARRSRHGEPRALVRIVLPIVAFALSLTLWEVLVRGLDIKRYILPAPSVVYERFIQVIPSLWDAALVTASEVLMGFALAAVVSIPLAYLIASVRVIEIAFYPLIVVLQTIPKIAVAPLFIVWFGFGMLPKVLLTFLLCFFPILVDTLTGFKALDQRLLYITKSMGASRLQTFGYVRMPAALPFIFSGLKVAVVLAVTGAIVAEFVGSNAGLGYLLLRASANLDTPLIFSVLVVLSLLGLLFAYAVELAERLVTPWQRKH
ncbi:ABC transporter permease [Actinotalea caeni]|uniref:ABC transporter permease n=1 Tax=Actinotalea caeni TaxID=1348467 RepID=UPI0012E30F91|nr:ABC transporter permease [Actinotalea caeni]